jgi:hypothetical protein
MGRRLSRRLPNSDRFRGLCTEAIMLAHGFTTDMMVEMIRDGLAAVSAERMVAGGKSIEITRAKITDAGRRALTER